MKNQKVPDDLISAYFDGEVTQDERRQVEQLLESSAESRQLLEDAAKLSAILHSFPREAAPADLARNVRLQIESSTLVAPASSPAKRTGLRREWIAFAAGILATVAPLVMYVVVNPTQQVDHSAVVSLHSNDERAGGHGSEMVLRSEGVPQKMALKLKGLLPEAPGAAKPIGTGIPSVASEHVELATSESAAPSVSGRSVVSNGSEAVGVASSMVAGSALSFSTAATEPAVDATDDGILLNPDDPDHFIQSLKKGEIAVRSVANTNDAVAVVELIVVDINRGADEMEMLLLRVMRNLNASDDTSASPNQGDAKALGIDKDEALRESLARAKSSDEMAMLYVRAPGDQLAQALAEAIKRPEMYLAVSPKVPMTFPGEPVAPQPVASSQVTDSASVKAGASSAKAVASPNVEKPVSVEAGLVVNSFLSLNGIEAKNKDGVMNIQQNGMAREFFFHAQPGSSVPPSAPVAIAEDRNADTNSGDGQQQGFITSYRVSVPKNTAANEQARDRKRKVTSRSLLQNASVPNQTSQKADDDEQKSEQAHQDPQLVRMLIVLKSGQANTPP